MIPRLRWALIKTVWATALVAFALDRAQMTVRF